VLGTGVVEFVKPKAGKSNRETSALQPANAAERRTGATNPRRAA
jgi:hypothetical protein